MMATELGKDVLPAGTNDTWRTWLLTGMRRSPVDRRRVRGAHKGLKRMLVEGMAISPEKPYTWKEFSDAMVRQSVGDAVLALSRQDAQVLKLAYFGGMSNHDIAERLGLSVASVERRLRGAVESISHHVERGRSLGRQALAGLVLWLAGRRLDGSIHHALQAGVVVVAAGIIAAGPTVMDRPGAHSAPSQVAMQQAAPLRAVAANHALPSPSAAPGVRTVPATPTLPQAPTVVVNLPLLPAVALPPTPTVRLPNLPVPSPRGQAGVQLPLRS